MNEFIYYSRIRFGLEISIVILIILTLMFKDVLEEVIDAHKSKANCKLYFDIFISKDKSIHTRDDNKIFGIIKLKMLLLKCFFNTNSFNNARLLKYIFKDYEKLNLKLRGIITRYIEEILELENGNIIEDILKYKGIIYKDDRNLENILGHMILTNRYEHLIFLKESRRYMIGVTIMRDNHSFITNKLYIKMYMTTFKKSKTRKESFICFDQNSLIDRMPLRCMKDKKIRKTIMEVLRYNKTLKY